MKTSVCVCTYGRPELLEETIFSFLQQTNTEAEMIIVNDRHDQELVFNHPRVRIINSPTRFGSTGEKRKYSANLATTPWLMFWDDDDVILPWHIDHCIERLRYFHKNKLSRAKTQWIYTDANGLELFQGKYVHTLLIHKDVYWGVGGQDNITRGEDVSLTTKLLSGGLLAHTGLPPLPPAYIQRYNTGRARVADLGPRRDKNLERMELLKLDADEQNKTGVIELAPQWRKDWIGLHNKTWKGADSPRRATMVGV